MNKEKDIKKLKKDLKNLGSSVKEIVKTLKKQNIKGKIEDGLSCPIANYLKSLKYRNVFITQYGNIFADYERKQNCLGLHKNNIISKFIRNFDNGKYPELIATNKKKSKVTKTK